jgi:succinate-acetate transporter protein
MALFYGGLVQLLAGMWEMKVGNTFSAVVFSSYAGFWMGFAALHVKAFGFLDGYTVAGVTDHHQLNADLAVFLIAWTIFTILMGIAAHRTSILLVTLFGVVVMTFLMLAIHHFCQNKYIVLQQTSGCFGIIASFMAWYGAFAALLTDRISLFRLPVGELDPIYRKWGWLPPLEVEKPTN